MVQNSRTTNAVRNAAAGILNRFVGVFMPFILRTVLIKVLGEQYLGLNNLFTSVLQVLSLADLGFHSAIVYSMYRPIIEDDREKICALLNLYRKLYAVIGIIVLVAGLAFIPFLDHIIKGGYPADLNITILYLMYLSNTVLSYVFFSYRRALFSAHQRSDIGNNINSVVQIVMDILKLIILFETRNYYLYILILPITTLLSNILIFASSCKKYPQYKCKGRIDQTAKKEIVKKVSALAIQRFGNTISTSLDSIIVSSFLGLSFVAIYGNYFYIVSSLLSFINVCISGTTAGVGNSIVVDSVDKNFKVFKKINMINQWIISWCVPCLVCLYQHFMNIWVGRDLMMGTGFAICMTGYFYVAETRKVVQVFKDAAGMWWADKWKPLAGCLTNLIFNIVSVQYIGMYGVILSTIISYLLIELPWETGVLFRNYFKGYLREYIKDNLCYLGVTCAASLAVWLICSYLPGTGVLFFCIKGVVSFAVSNLFFVVVFFKRDEFAELYKVVLNYFPLDKFKKSKKI